MCAKSLGQLKSPTTRNSRSINSKLNEKNLIQRGETRKLNACYTSCEAMPTINENTVHSTQLHTHARVSYYSRNKINFMSFAVQFKDPRMTRLLA